MTDPEFLDLEDVLIIHEDQLGRYGGVGRPARPFGGQFDHEDLFAMAAAYAFHIAENQAP